MIAVLVIGGLMAYLVAGFAIYALWVPSYLKDDTFGWALLNVVFWPLLLPYVEPKEKNHGTDRQAEADHRDSGSGDPANNEPWHQARAAAGAGANPSMGSLVSGYGVKNSGSLTSKEIKRLSEEMDRWIRQSIPSFAGSTLSAPPPKPEIERVKSTMPIMATRWAKIALSPEGPKLKSVTDYGDTFGVDADAVCTKHRESRRYSAVGLHGFYPEFHTRPQRHDAPDLDCTCGFHAVPSDKLPKHKSYGGLQLLVELSGTVIEHEEGYRAGHQRVLEATIPRCAGCGETAARAWLTPDVSDYAALWDCGEHEIMSGDGTLMAVTVDQLAKSLGVPFVAKSE